MESFATRIEVVDEAGISVLEPMRNLRARPLPTGSTVRAYYDFQRKSYRFASVVIGRSGEYDVLSMPSRIESTERRRNFRLDAALEPTSVYRLVIDPVADEETKRPLEGTLVDLSEGGLCLSSRLPAAPGERLGIEIELPRACVLLARMRVISVDPPRYGYRNHRIHCSFMDLSRQGRDTIAKFLMKRQIELRQRGQL
jgi:c-di-GMP-binding flagellar brake protein YcgR